MKLILEVNKEKDIKMLLMLLERLNISYNTVDEVAPEKKDEGQGSAKNGASHQKNFNAEKIKVALKELKENGVFESISNPAKWQKQLRDEWE